MEGADVVAAALAAGRRPQAVFLREEAAGELAERLGLTGSPAVFTVTERVAARLSALESPADVMAVFALPERRSLSSLSESPPGREAGGLLVVYLDGVQDPGNVGTLTRAAVAFGASALATSPGSADPYGPKTVRASMGALFGLPVFPDVRLDEVLRELPRATVFGLAAHGGEPLDRAELRRPAVLVVGAERAGLSPAALAHVGRLVTIPLSTVPGGAVESLNAGMAGAIALYEFSRRPAGAPDDPPRRAPAPQEG